MLKQENAFVRVFKQATAQNIPELQVHIYGRPWLQARSYNRPRAADIALFIPSEQIAEVQKNPHDIVVQRCGGGLQAGYSSLLFLHFTLQN